MSSLTVSIATEGRHYRITVHVDGQVEPTTVFGCRFGFAPVVNALESTEGKQYAILPSSEPAAVGGPPAITFHLPSGRALTFALAPGQDAHAGVPQFASEVLPPRGAGDPVN